MAKMTYQSFARSVENIFADAQRNLERDGHVAEVLMGLDAYGRWTVNIIAGPDEPDEAELRLAAAHKMTVFPGSLRGHAEPIAELFRRTKTVAAILVSESWMVMSKTLAQEVLDSGRSVADHPGRVEVVVVEGAWPKEYQSRVLTALILRDEHGHPYARPGFVQDNTSQHGPLDDRMVSWLAQALPQPYGRPSRPDMPGPNTIRVPR